MPIQYFKRPTNWQEITEAMRDPSKLALLAVELGFSDEIADYFDRLIENLEEQQALNKDGEYFVFRVNLSDTELKSWQDWQIQQEFDKDSKLSFDRMYMNEWMPPLEEVPESFTQSKLDRNLFLGKFLGIDFSNREPKDE